MPGDADALRAQVAEIEARRREQLSAAADAVELKILQEKIKLAELEAKEGLVGRDIAAIFSPKTGAMVVVKTPAPVQYQKFQKKAIADKVDIPDLFELIHSCLVYPSKKEFESICDAAPGMLSSTIEALTTLNGAADSDAAGK